MYVYLLNDTRNYHSGSKAVCDFISKQVLSSGYKIKTDLEGGDELLKEADIVILNGEGTLHDNAGAAKRLFRQLKQAQEYNLKTAVVNFTWHNMDNSYDDILGSGLINVMQFCLARKV